MSTVVTSIQTVNKCRRATPVQISQLAGWLPVKWNEILKDPNRSKWREVASNELGCHYGDKAFKHALKIINREWPRRVMSNNVRPGKSKGFIRSNADNILTQSSSTQIRFVASTTYKLINKLVKRGILSIEDLEGLHLPQLRMLVTGHSRDFQKALDMIGLDTPAVTQPPAQLNGVHPAVAHSFEEQQQQFNNGPVS